MVIYADVLFIINFFITFLLLEVTARLTKKEAKTIRLILASVLGGGYSMILLAEKLPFYLSLLSKVLAAVLMLLTAFRFYRVKSFLLTLLVFLFTNFVFLGIIIGLYMIFRSDFIAVNNSSVYFDISARGLLFCAFISYLLSCLIVRIYNRRMAKGEIYTLEIENNGQSVTLFALADTGNKLREPFTDAPVIVAQTDRVSALATENRIRLIPASTVNDESFLKAFKADKVTVKTDKGKEVVENAYIAMSDNLVGDGCHAVINPEILSV